MEARSLPREIDHYGGKENYQAYLCCFHSECLLKKGFNSLVFDMIAVLAREEVGLYEFLQLVADSFLGSDKYQGVN